MGKRLGRKRLYSLEKKGQSNTNTPFSGISGAIGHTKVSRDGNLITTEITIDLGTSAAAICQSCDANAAIGTGSKGASLGQITTAVNGIVTEAEFVCLETPLGGITGSDIDVSYGTGSTTSYSSSAGLTRLINAGGENVVIGKNFVQDIDDNALSDKHLYLTNGFTTDVAPPPTGNDASTHPFTAGKLVLRLYGYAVPDDL